MATDPAQRLRAEVAAVVRVGSPAHAEDARLALDAAATDAARLAAAMQTLLRHRTPGTICPSDAARLVGGERWRDLMPLAREVAARLATDGWLVVTQKGREVDVTTARGPVRLAAGRRLGGQDAGA